MTRGVLVPSRVIEHLGALRHEVDVSAEGPVLRALHAEAGETARVPLVLLSKLDLRVLRAGGHGLIPSAHSLKAVRRPRFVENSRPGALALARMEMTREARR